MSWQLSIEKKQKKSAARLIRNFYFVMLLFIVWVFSSSCAARRASVPQDRSIEHNATRIGKDVTAGPGSVAWSPDGKTLAFIGDQVYLYDAISAKSGTVPIKAASSLAWSPDNKLFVVSRSRERDIISLVDRASLSVLERETFEGAEAVYITQDNRGFLVLAKTMSIHSYGTAIALRVVFRGHQKTDTRSVYNSQRIYPTRQPDLKVLFAWTHAGLNPVDNSLLMIEYVKPPVMAAYSRLFTVDTLSRDVTEITGKEHHAVYISASWSPDGRQLALTDENGLLSIRTLKGEEKVIDEASTGLYPSWSPNGDWIYTGGMLVSPQGKNKELLLSNSAGSIGAWSPDGRRLAVVSSGDLWLFDDIGHCAGCPSSRTDIAAVRKMSLLQDLFREGLITADEYKERRSKLMGLEDK